jgi:ribosomal protein L31
LAADALSLDIDCKSQPFYMGELADKSAANADDFLADLDTLEFQV